MAGKASKKTIKNSSMLFLTYAFVALFLALMVYLIYFQVCISDDVINSPYNRKRQELLANKVVRGDILTADGKVLATTDVDESGKETRQYPFGNMYAHVVGYASQGGSGLEAYNNIRLLRSNDFFGKRISNSIIDEKNEGDNVFTTLNSTLQETAYKALGSHKGAVVVMEPDTGKILSMVSKPDYDPNEIDEIWDSVTNSDTDEGVLLNRAAQGQYPPGSTFKIFSTLEYIRENKDYGNYSYTCKGSHAFEDLTINCYHKTVHGSLNLIESFAKSCNSSFVNIGTGIDRMKLRKLCEDFYFNKSLAIGIPTKTSKFNLDKSTSTYDLLQTVIGQGSTLVTPLEMAMTVSTIYNKGIMMKPYLVDHTESIKGGTVKTFQSKQLAKPVSDKEAGILKDFMLETVKSGTATRLKTDSYTVGGKTGSAEFGTEKGKSHAWFVGFACKNDHPIVVSIIVEGAGSGSEFAVPIAEKIFDEYYQ